ncbi:MAG: DNA polymerase III alpha subunit, partial [uncultured Quadrisphaera sp.]
AVGRPVRPPAQPHRVLDARRRRAGRRAVRRGRRAGHARAGHDRPRLRLRRLRVLAHRPEARGQADHRRRGVPDPGHVPLRPHPRQVGRRLGGPRRRLRRRRLHAHDDVGQDHGRHAQPVPRRLPRQPRGALLQAPDGPRAAVAVRPGPHRHHRLPLRRGADPPAPGPVPAGQGGGLGAARPVRGRELLLRADGPRPRHRAPRAAGPAAPGPRARPAAGGHQRPALHPQGARGGPRGAAVRAVRLDPGRPQPVQVRRRRLLPQDRRADAPPVARAARGLRQHPAHRRDVRGRLHRGHGHLHAPLPRARGGVGDVLVRQGGRGRAADALQGRGARGVAPPGGVRDRRHHPDGVRRLLPRRRRLHPLGQAQRHPRRPRARLGRRLDRRVRPGDHRPRPAAPRPDLRAVPQPRPRLDARLRRRLRRAPPRRGDPLRHREVRRGPGRPDRHLRHDQGQAGRQGRLPRARVPLRHGRADHQGDARRGDGQGRAAVEDLRPRAPPLQRGRGVPRPARRRRRGGEGRRHRQAARGPQAPVGRARGRGDHVQRAAGRPHPDHAPRAGRAGDHAVRLPQLRGPRPDQDGLPRPAQPDDHGRRAGEHRAQPRRDRGARGARARRPRHLRPAGQGRDPRGLPVRRRADALAAAPDAPRQLRGHLRRRRPVPPGPDGRRLAHQLRAAQEQAAGRDPDPPRARGAPARGARHHLRPDRVPGAGHGHRAEGGRVLPRPGRPAAPGHGQEEEVRAGQAVRDLLRRHGRARVLGGGGQGAVGRAAAVLRLRVQQGALRGLRGGLVLDGVPQGPLPGRVHGRAADLGAVRQGQVGAVPGRVPAHAHHGAAPRRQHLDRHLRRGRRGHPLRAGRGAQRRRERRRGDRRGPHREGRVHLLRRLPHQGARRGVQQAHRRVADQGRGVRLPRPHPPPAPRQARGGRRPGDRPQAGGGPRAVRPLRGPRRRRRRGCGRRCGRRALDRPARPARVGQARPAGPRAGDARPVRQRPPPLRARARALRGRGLLDRLAGRRRVAPGRQLRHHRRADHRAAAQDDQAGQAVGDRHRGGPRGRRRGAVLPPDLRGLRPPARARHGRGRPGPAQPPRRRPEPARAGADAARHHQDLRLAGADQLRGVAADQGPRPEAARGAGEPPGPHRDPAGPAAGGRDPHVLPRRAPGHAVAVAVRRPQGAAGAELPGL